jgi:SPP1 family predicted phage head-tail adaptor
MDRQGKKTLATEARHYITIQRNMSTTDGEGGFGDTWSTVQSCFAAIYPIKAIQQFQYKSIGVDATHFIKLRGYVDISELDQIICGSRTFEVLTVENIQERNFEQFVTCKEVR